MTIQNIPLMKAMAAKMVYLEQRQGILSHNIANADTPGYRAHDLTKVDFGTVLKDVIKSGEIRLETTNSRHMPSLGEVEQARDMKQKITYEVSPTNNAVILEEQMVK